VLHAQVLADLERSVFREVSVTGGLFLFGLLMAISPTTFGIEFDVEAHTPTSRRFVRIIAASVAAGATVLAVLFLLVSPNAIHAVLNGEVRTILAQRWLDATVGVLFVAVGILRLRDARRPRKPKHHDDLNRPRVLATTVFANSIIGSSSFTTMYLVVRLLGTVRPVAWPIAYAGFLLGIAVPYVLVDLAWERFPRFSKSVTALMGDLSRRDLRRPVALVVIVVGAGLLLWNAAAILR
jgi:uncharacterized membrane protein (DUF485 family)